MTRYSIIKYLVAPNGSACLHIVAYKGGGRVNVMCGETFDKSRTKTITTVPRHCYVCRACSDNTR